MLRNFLGLFSNDIGIDLGTANTLVYSIFFDAFVGTPQRGIASAQAYLLAIMVIALSLVQFTGLGKKVHYQ